MRSLWHAAGSITCLMAMVALFESCGGSSRSIQPLIITTSTLPNGTAGTQYSQSIHASGGVGGYRWTVSSGALPQNLQLGPSNSNSDTISGTPDTPAQLDTFTVQVIDAANQSATQTYSVSILGLPDVLTLAPPSLSFNPLQVGTSSTSRTATLANTGTTTVAINSVASTGTNGGDFAQSNTCVLNLAAGANCGISVTFTPSQAGPRVASITINDDTAATPHQLALNGVGLTPGANATLSAPNLSFGSQAVGTPSPAQTLTLTNYGTTTLNVTNITTTGDFAETSNCGTSVASAASCPISVSFTPTAVGALNGTLSLIDNALDSPQTVTLSGTGVQQKCTPPGGRCHHRGSCCPVNPPFHDICGAQGICIVE